MKNISIYKPNKKNEGCACSFYLGKDNNVYVNAIQQFSWDEGKRTGSFAENAKNKDKSLSIKLNEFECGGLIRAIRTYTEFSAFHTYEDNKTTISFKPWIKGDEKQTKAFGLSITRNSTDKFKLPIEASEAETIRVYLEECLRVKFHEDVSQKKDSRSQQ